MIFETIPIRVNSKPAKNLGHFNQQAPEMVPGDHIVPAHSTEHSDHELLFEAPKGPPASIGADRINRQEHAR